ncbi:hypothetical protein ACFLQ1_01445 [Candidatus Auribacterota bacterium]
MKWATKNVGMNTVLEKYNKYQTIGERFPLEEYGYFFESDLNSRNTWERKTVSSILKDNQKRYVSTTFTEDESYNRFLKISQFLKKQQAIHPEIEEIYPNLKTVVCNYVGEFLPTLLLSEDRYAALDAISDYVNFLCNISPKKAIFSIPYLVERFLKLAEQVPEILPFISETAKALPIISKKGLHFSYGFGIGDPDMNNFRVVKNMGVMQALTTDYGYWSDRVNYHWALGYFYSSLRWLTKTCPKSSIQCEDYLLTKVIKNGIDDEFMFWFGVLTGYCGYVGVIEKALIKDELERFQSQLDIIKELDTKVSLLAEQLIANEGEPEFSALNAAIA